MEEMIIRVNNAYERTLQVSKIKALGKIFREMLTNVMLIKGEEINHSRARMDWVDKIEQLMELEVLDKGEALMIKERLIDGW
jgi:hypothetical protein